MTRPVPRRPRPAAPHSRGSTEPPPIRPLLTTPPHTQHQASAGPQRQRPAAQPWLGVGGLLGNARTRCPREHWFNGPVDSLALPQQSHGWDEGQTGLPVDHGGPGGGSWRAAAS